MVHVCTIHSVLVTGERDVCQGRFPRAFFAVAAHDNDDKDDEVDSKATPPRRTLAHTHTLTCSVLRWLVVAKKLTTLVLL
jgi:hypothetical protein